MMRTESLTHEPGTDARRAWLASLLLRQPTWLSRFAARLSELASLGRGQRLRLERKAAVSLAGAALLLSLAGPLGSPPARADTDATNATISVVNGEVAISANGKCSLMEAIINARATAAGQMKADCVAGNISRRDVVSLPTSGLFILTSPHNTQHGPTGLPVITTDMVIEGNGATIRRSGDTGTPLFRILDVDPGVTFTLRNTSIVNGDLGYWQYGDYQSGGSLGLHGGGIFSQGNLIIEGSTISGNRSHFGGGIHATTVTVTNSVIANNTADSFVQAEGGGIAAITATITGSRILDNTLVNYYYGGYGGGISADQLTLVDSVVSGNEVTGGIDEGKGGGVSLRTGSIIGSTISNNKAGAGYEPDDYGNPSDPGKGGGVYMRAEDGSGLITIANSTISANEANRGGGLFVAGPDLNLIHATVTGNHASQLVSRYDEGNGYVRYEVFAGEGGGIYANKFAGTYPAVCGDVSLRGTILSGNTADGDGQEAAMWTYSGCTPTITTGAFNVIGHDGVAGTEGFTPGVTDIVPTAALSAILGPLADNGGPTQTHALLAGSPALDRAPTASCMAAPINGVDQRGQPRNVDGDGKTSSAECDIGAFEYKPAPPPPTPTATPRPTATPKPTSTPKPTNTPAPTATASPTPTTTPTVSPTPGPSPTTEPSPTATATVSPSPTPTTRPFPFGVWLPIVVDADG